MKRIKSLVGLIMREGEGMIEMFRRRMLEMKELSAIPDAITDR